MSDETMVEKVTQAIADNIEAGLPAGSSVDWRYAARAAIEAMRNEDDITDKMLDAGCVALHAPENRHGAVLGAVFCAMIDAALQETPHEHT